MVLCSGKHYYALDAYRREKEVRDTAIIRLEVSNNCYSVATYRPRNYRNLLFHLHSCYAHFRVPTFTKNSRVIPMLKVRRNTALDISSIAVAIDWTVLICPSYSRNITIAVIQESHLGCSP